MDRASPEIAAVSAEITKPGRHRGKLLTGYGLAAAGLAWVFHDVRLGEMFRNVASISWGWVSLAVLFDIASYVCQGVRWSLLLNPAGRISTWKTTEAIYAGLFVNEVLPLRAGEVLRIYLVRRQLPTSLGTVVSSVLVERFFDAIWLTLAVGVTILLVPLPGYLVKGEGFLAGVVFSALAIFVYVVARKERPVQIEGVWPPEGGSLRARLLRVTASLATGLQSIGRSRYLYLSFLVSGLLLVFQIAAFWLVMWACGLRLSFWHGAAVLLIVHLGTAIPSAPSNVGTYQFFVVVGLALFGVEKTVATGFSVMVFLILTVPLWALGLVAIGRAGLSWRNLRSQVSTLAAQ